MKRIQSLLLLLLLGEFGMNVHGQNTNLNHSTSYDKHESITLNCIKINSYALDSLLQTIIEDKEIKMIKSDYLLTLASYGGHTLIEIMYISDPNDVIDHENRKGSPHIDDYIPKDVRFLGCSIFNGNFFYICMYSGKNTVNDIILKELFRYTGRKIIISKDIYDKAENYINLDIPPSLFIYDNNKIRHYDNKLNNY